jgi:hypothetical protein
MVIVAEPVPPPLQAPEPAIATPSPEFAVAATGKVLLITAVDGAWVVTAILWVAFCAAVPSVTWGATS